MSVLTAYASAARTATPTAWEVSGVRARAMLVVVDATAITSTPSVVPTIDGYDPVSGKYFNLLTGAAITAVTAARVLRIAPGLTASANLTVNDVVPNRIRITMTHADADSITYSVSVHLLD